MKVVVTVNETGCVAKLSENVELYVNKKVKLLVNGKEVEVEKLKKGLVIGSGSKELSLLLPRLVEKLSDRELQQLGVRFLSKKEIFEVAKRVKNFPCAEETVKVGKDEVRVVRTVCSVKPKVFVNGKEVYGANRKYKSKKILVGKTRVFVHKDGDFPDDVFQLKNVVADAGTREYVLHPLVEAGIVEEVRIPELPQKFEVEV